MPDIDTEELREKARKASEELREHSSCAQQVAWGRTDGGQDHMIAAATAEEAADAIAGLLDLLQSETERADRAERERDEARAFGARLREALEAYEEAKSGVAGDSYDGIEPLYVSKLQHASGLARVALYDAALASSTAESGWRPISEAADAIRASRPVLVTHIPFTGRAPINCVRWCGGPQKSGLRWRIVGHERKPLRYEPTHFQEIEEPVNPARLKQEDEADAKS